MIQKIAGCEWTYSFLKRLPRLTTHEVRVIIRKQRIRNEQSKVGAFFKVLERKMAELVHVNKPERIFNANEPNLQMDTRGGHIVCEEGS
jgi:hypothetical protein